MNKTGFNPILLIFLFAPFLKPAEYVFGGAFDLVMNGWKVFSCIIILLLYLFRAKFSAITILISVFQLMLIASTLINHGKYLQQIVHSGSVICLCMLFEIFLSYSAIKTLQGVYYYAGAIALITALAMYYFYPNGIGEQIPGFSGRGYGLLGNYNSSFFLIFPIIICGLLYTYMRDSKITLGFRIFSLIIGGAYIYVWSVAAFCGFIALWFFMLFYKRLNSKIFNIKNYLLADAASFIILVILQIQFQTGNRSPFVQFIRYVIQDILQKDLTLTGRASLWSKAINYIMASPLYGYGYEQVDVLYMKFGIEHVHNIVLDILYQGGIIGMAAYLAFLFLCTKKLIKTKDHPVSKILSFSLFILILVGMADYYNSRYMLFILYVLSYHADEIIAQYEQTKADRGLLQISASKYIKT